jgi:hypothetical protein
MASQPGKTSLKVLEGMVDFLKKVSGPNDCGTCFYKQTRETEGHCYMFREKPEGLCGKYREEL